MALLPNYLFNPETYASPGMGGLLGNLPMYFTQPGQSAGFPTMAPTDMSAAARQPGPPMQITPQAPAATPAQPSAFDRFLAGINDNADMLMGLGAGIAQGGIGKGLQLGAQLSAGKRGQTDDIREYEFAKTQGFRGTFQDWIANKRAGAGEYGLNVQWGVDAQGNPVMIQPGKTGRATVAQLPEGVRLSKEPIKLDAGTHFVLLDPITRQPVGTVPKQLAEAAAETARGKVQGGLQANLPTDLLSAEQTVRQIDELLNHEGLNSIVGQVDQFRPSWMLGDKGADALARWEQLKGKSFLQAYQTLKGGGQITEVEGLKAENAMARMNRAQGEAEFKQALRDFRDAVVAGTRKLQERAGVPASEITVPAGAATPVPTNIRRYNPATGKIE